jgi:16S rRNA (cytosine967-C5)-methyltransferase
MKRALPPSSPNSPALHQQLDAAAQVLTLVRKGRSLPDALTTAPSALRPGVQALVSDTLRELGRAQAQLALLVPRKPAPWVEALLLICLALLNGPRYPSHTLVSQAVEACKRRARPASGLVNAVLRRILREPEALPAVKADDLSAIYNHPAWWVRRLQRDWPQHWEALLAANQQAAPMTLRVNRRHGTASAYRQRLLDAGWHDIPQPIDDAIVLPQAAPVDQLPGWTQGDVSIQDLAAQQAAHLLLTPAGLPVLAPGARVLDACAAPGGKTAHLLEQADLDVLALEIDAHRAERIHDTLQRLRLNAEVKVGDGSQPNTWWDGRLFDAILLDAPCSASGIVRRHPDVRWLRRETDIAALNDAQDRLLDALWPLLKPGGRLLYCTCSVFKAEGEERIDAFLQRHPGACRQAAPGHLLPVVEYPDDLPRERGDGFFYALLTHPCVDETC